MNDYSDHPQTMGELRVGRTDDALDWSPRDALIRVLRRLDAGEIKPECLAVVYAQRMDEPGATKSAYATTMIQSGNALMVDGMLSRALMIPGEP